MSQVAAAFQSGATWATGTVLVSIITICLVLAALTFAFTRSFMLVGIVFLAGIVAAASPGIAQQLYSWAGGGGGGIGG